MCNVFVNLLRCIHHFKSDLINNMGHVRILGTEPGITFAWIIHLRPEVEIRSGVGPVLSVVSRDCIRNRSGVGRRERGLVSRKDGCRSGRAGFERGCIRDTARIQRGFIGDRYALQSERVIFYPIIPDQAIKIGREWAGVGRASGVNVALQACGWNDVYFWGFLIFSLVSFLISRHITASPPQILQTC